MLITIALVSAISILVPATAGTILIRKIEPMMRILYGLVIFTLVLEVISVIAHAYHINNMALFHSYVYVEFLAISWIFYTLFEKRIWKRITLLFLLSFAIFSVINVGFYEGIMDFNSNQRYVQGLMVITYCVAYYSQLIRLIEEPRLTLVPAFWLSSGWLVYFAGTLLLFTISRELINNNMRGYFEIHAILNIALNGIFTIALILSPKR